MARHVAAALAVLAFLTQAASSAAQPALVPLSMDPFDNPESIHRTIVEPSVYAWGHTMVSAFQVGRIFDGGAADIGFATSRNRGRTWTSGLLRGTTAHVSPAGPYYSVSDPSVAYDPRHRVWLIAFLGIVSGDASDVLVARSSDDGLTWSDPVVVDGSGTSDGVSNDKTWITCDGFRRSPFFGRCYTQYTNFDLSGRIQMTASSDGGLTWGAPQGSPSNAAGQGGQPVTQPNGTVIVPFVGIFGEAVRSFRSTDGGASWSNPVDITPLAYHQPGGDLRAPSVTSISAGVDATGTVYLVWPECTHQPGCTANDIVLSTSADGASWTTPVVLPLDGPVGGEDRFIPGLGVGRRSRGARARLGLTFHYYPTAACDTDTCALNVAFVSSRNGGATWSDPIQLAGPMSLPWLPLTTLGYMVGDYVATAIPSSRKAFPVLVAASPPNGEVLDEVVYTVDGGLPITGGTRPVVEP